MKPKFKKEKRKINIKLTCCRLILISFLLISSSLVYSQEYLQVNGTKQLFRYFKNLKQSVEVINDSISVVIEKRNNFYYLKVFSIGKEYSDCQYYFAGKKVTQRLRIREINAKGRFYKSQKVFVKILVPSSENCLMNLNL
jgi:hypothetical protein